MKTRTVYKIKRNDGMFSTGGMYPSFTKKGKEWKRKGDLSNHIHITDHNKYSNCIVVEYELSYVKKQTIDLAEMIKLSEERSQAIALEHERQSKKNRRKYLLNELETLDK